MLMAKGIFFMSLSSPSALKTQGIPDLAHKNTGQ